MSKPQKKIPKFKNEAQEQAFWATEDSADYMDWGKAKQALFPNLKPTSKTISLRLPGALLAELRILANRQDVPYQSLIKIYLAERVRGELSM